jgi:uncharacterized protein YxeA
MVLKKNKKGLSEVVAVVIIILLVIVTTAIVWTSVNSLIKNKTEGVKSCFDVEFSDQVVFNNEYTCYNSSSREVQFSLSIGDVEIQKAIVTISAGGSSKTFIIFNEVSTFPDLVTYPNRNLSITLPPKNGGLTYIATGVNENPDWIKIAPYVDDKQCEITDTIYELQDCSLFE